jgi:hypothetical protein
VTKTGRESGTDWSRCFTPHDDGVTDAVDGRKGVGAHSEMRHSAEVVERQAGLGDGVRLGRARAHNRDGLGDHISGAASALGRLLPDPVRTSGGTGELETMRMRTTVPSTQMAAPVLRLAAQASAVSPGMTTWHGTREEPSASSTNVTVFWVRAERTQPDTVRHVNESQWRAPRERDARETRDPVGVRSTSKVSATRMTGAGTAATAEDMWRAAAAGPMRRARRVAASMRIDVEQGEEEKHRHTLSATDI